MGEKGDGEKAQSEYIHHPQARREQGERKGEEDGVQTWDFRLLNEAYQLQALVGAEFERSEVHVAEGNQIFPVAESLIRKNTHAQALKKEKKKRKSRRTPKMMHVFQGRSREGRP